MHAADLLTRRSELTPDREALYDVESNRRFTYADLNARACRTANWLRERGVSYGDRVSLLAHNGVAYLDLFFGCGKIGAVFTPLNWRLVPAELAYIVNNCAPRVLIVGPDFEAKAAALRDVTDVAHAVTLADFVAEAAAQPAAEPPRPPDLCPDSTHCILYTSGTTGRPKGALIPHRQVLWNCINTVISWGLCENDASPVLTPLFHAGGLFAFMLPLLYAGGRIVLTRGFDADQSLRLIADERCTTILGVPTLFQLWLDSPELHRDRLAHVRFFISGGAPCPPALMDAWRAATGTVLRQGFGMTEVGVNCFAMTDADSINKAGTVGKPIMHSAVRLVDADGHDVGPGETGELLIKGPHVCTGYLNNPAATAAAIQDGWFRTGDMARRDADGYYTIAGRFKDMIISGGENVYAAEVEAVYLEHPAVAECALIGRPDPKWGEVGVLFVVLRQPVDHEALVAHGGANMARYKIPKEFVVVDALPYSPYGKVEKVKLREAYGEREKGKGKRERQTDALRALRDGG